MLKSILRSKVYDVAERTPLSLATKLSTALGHSIFLKREDLQPVFSFKIRGAYNKIAHLSPDQREKGVMCASAGNHGQGVALSAQRLGCRAYIVMPETTPQIKVDAVKRLGAEVILSGDSYSDAYEEAMVVSQRTGAVMIHPFDDPLVIAGQGTVGKEIFEDCPQLDVVFVPIGGGGLAAGVASYLKEVAPEVKIVGVEPLDSDAMSKSIEVGSRVNLDQVGIFADGVAVRKVGELTFDLCQELLDGIIKVSTDDIASAISDIYQETRAIMEPAGALSLAGLKAYVAETSHKGQTLVAINSGANMNFQRLMFVAERASTGAGQEALLAIRLDERPGTLKTLCRVMAGRSFTEFNYRKSHHEEAHIFVGIGISKAGEHVSLLGDLKGAGYAYHDLTGNEFAKGHLRHMVGGSSPLVKRERLIHFSFPERPGALGEFLDKTSDRWNISLFHYRSHGADFGRVLIGFEVDEKEEKTFLGFLEMVGLPYADETDNPAVKLFL